MLAKDSPRKRGASSKAQTPALLKGLIFDSAGAAMSPTHTRKGGKLYRYYISQKVLKNMADANPASRVPAAEIERIVTDQVRNLLCSPEAIVATWKAARTTIKGITEREVREALMTFEPLWTELFPLEQARIIQLLVERVQVNADSVDVTLKVEGFTALVAELREDAEGDRQAA